MKTVFILCVIFFAVTAGCETREQVMQKREGNQILGSLEAAVYMGEVENVRSLIMQGANVNARFKDGGTPLFSAIERIPAERNFRDLIGRRREVIRLLLKAGADPMVEKNGKSLIDTAQEGGDAEIDQMLEEAAEKPTL